MPFNATTCGCLKRCSNILIAFDKPPGTSSNPATARLACILWPQTKCIIETFSELQKCCEVNHFMEASLESKVFAQTIKEIDDIQKGKVGSSFY